MKQRSRLASIRYHLATGALVLAAAFSFVGTARAAGTVTIGQTDGHSQVYANVGIHIVNDVLFLTSGDGSGTLAVQRAACSYQGDLLVCLPSNATLIQGGSVTALNPTKGAVVVNLTTAAHVASGTSTTVPPRSVVFSMVTSRGTIVKGSGHIDG